MRKVYQRRTPSVKSCVNGLLVDTGCVYRVPDGSKRAKRGEVVNFSRASRRRLQNALLALAPPPGWVRYGICLTVPGYAENWGDDWRAVINRFKTNLTRGLFLHCGTYRVELQKRKMPHIHAVMFTNAPNWECGAMEVSAAWEKALDGWNLQDRKPFKIGVAVYFEPLTRSASLRYLYDHTSKQKQEQLGYVGRQWGYIGRKWLWDTSEVVDLTEWQMVVLERVLRRWSRRWYKGRYKGRLARCKSGTASYTVPMTTDLRVRVIEWVSTVPERSAPETGEEESRITPSPAPVEGAPASSAGSAALHSGKGGSERGRPFSASPRQRGAEGASGASRTTPPNFRGSASDRP